MSALAARRAAAASATATNEVPTSTTTEIPKSRTPVKSKITPKPANLPITNSVQSSASGDSEQELQAVLDTPNKRRKVDDSTPARPRYFAKAVTPPSPARRRQVKRFSPSAPVSESGEDSSDDGDEGDIPVTAEDEIEHGGVDWKVLHESKSSVEPAKKAAYNTGINDQSTKFMPKEGVNLIKLTQEELREAGLVDDIPGPGVIISLGSHEELMIAGTYTLTPLINEITICSTSLIPSPSPTSHYIFAPTSHPLPVISSGAHSPISSQHADILAKLPLPNSFSAAGTTPEASRSVFLIRELHTGINGLKGGAVPGFQNIWLEEKGSWGLRGVHPVIGSFPTPVYPYMTPPSWTSALDSLRPPKPLTNGHALYDEDPTEGQSPIIAIVKGPKRSGKSTIARAALNGLLGGYEKVAWLECDLGQGEFSCGGVVGIWIVDKPVFGPAFTHPRLPERAHYLGTYTPLTCPDEYIAAIQNLIEHYRYETQYPSSAFSSASPSSKSRRNDIIPLVVNTQGWVKGLGEGLLLGIERMVQPTHIFGFTSPNFDLPDETAGWTNSPPPASLTLPINIYGSTYTNAPHTTQEHFTLEPAPMSPLQARYTASDLRILSTMSYFHTNLTASHVSWDFTRPLLAIPPWEVTLGRGIEQVYLIGEGSDGVIPEDLHLALNGSIVALLEVVDGAQLPEGGTYAQNRVLPALEETNFLGLAFVRAVQGESTADGLKIRLITPLAPDILTRVKVMVRSGALEMPTCGFMDWLGGVGEEGMVGMGWGDIPFLDVGGEVGVGGERRKYRRNIMRKGM